AHGALGAARIAPMALLRPARALPEVAVVAVAARLLRDLDRAPPGARRVGRGAAGGSARGGGRRRDAPVEPARAAIRPPPAPARRPRPAQRARARRDELHPPAARGRVRDGAPVPTGPDDA